MTCRSRGLSSAVTSYARLVSGLTETQVQHLYHRLLREHPDLEDVADPDDVLATVLDLAQRVEHDPSLSDARKRSLLARLAAEHPNAEPDPVPARVLHAVAALTDRCQVAAAGIDSAIHRTARDTGMTIDQVHAQYIAALTASDSGPAPTREKVAAWQLRGLPADDATTQALTTLDRLRADALAACPTRPTVTRHPVHDDQLAAVGYDPTTRYLEVEFQSRPGRHYSYRVPHIVAEELLSSADMGRYYATQIMSRPEYTFPDPDSWQAAATQYRCPTCGRYATRDLGCSCPPRGSTAERDHAWAYAHASTTGTAAPADPTVLPAGGTVITDLDMAVTLPREWMINEALTDRTAVNAPVTVDDPLGTITGQIDLRDGAVEAVTADCSCTGSRCAHTTAIRDALQHITGGDADSAAHTIAGITTLTRPAQTLWVSQPAPFADVTATPTAPLYLPYDVTAGIAADGTGRRFGVEIEFDMPPDMPPDLQDQARQRLGEALYRMGLTASKKQLDSTVHPQDTYAQTHERGWVFKTDPSCAGEISSPIMVDSEETWTQLARVLHAVRRYGGQASPATGMHVHVSAGDFTDRPDAPGRLADVLAGSPAEWLRLASHPDRGTHRGLQYCDLTNGVTNLGSSDDDRDTWVNFTHVTGDRARDHVEFRLWDGTLDPAVAQQQIALSVAATNLACSARMIPQSPSMGDPASAADPTVGARQLLDALWWRNRDKQQTARLWSITRWQELPSLYATGRTA